MKLITVTIFKFFNRFYKIQNLIEIRLATITQVVNNINNIHYRYRSGGGLVQVTFMKLLNDYLIY